MKIKISRCQVPKKLRMMFRITSHGLPIRMLKKIKRIRTNSMKIGRINQHSNLRDQHLPSSIRIQLPSNKHRIQKAVKIHSTQIQAQNKIKKKIKTLLIPTIWEVALENREIRNLPNQRELKDQIQNKITWIFMITLVIRIQQIIRMAPPQIFQMDFLDEELLHLTKRLVLFQERKVH